MHLPNYNKYIKKLKNFAKLCSIHLVFEEEEFMGEYAPTRRRIKISPDMNKTETLATVLHEFGHFMDDSKNPARWTKNHHYHGYSKIQQETREMSIHQKEHVWEAELEAWKNARALAAMLKIPLGKWFYDEEIKSLNSYRGIKIK